jgi:hypothetical protein
MKFNRIINGNFLLSLLVACLISTIAGCGGGSSESGTGTLSLSLKDAPVQNTYQAVYVTISTVQVQKENSTDWTTVASPNATYNLLSLVNGIMESLGIEALSTGHYTQIRLFLGASPDNTKNILGNDHPYPNYMIDENNNALELKVPSGYQTGIKLVSGFDIEAGLTRDLVLDFDAQKSIVIAGNSGNILLKPTIKVIGTVNNPVVTGTVFETDGTTGIEGVSVTAQIYNPAATDPKDKVTINAGTITDASGNYKLIPDDAGPYNIVAYKDGYLPEYLPLTTALNNTYSGQNMDLGIAAQTINITGSVSIPSGTSESSVTISYRLNKDGTQIEVASENILNGGSINIMLPMQPIWTYDIVVSSDGFTTQELTNVSADQILTLTF